MCPFLPRHLLLCVFLCAATMVARAAPTGASVSAADFGAKGDGIADDTAAIQRALDAASSGTAGVVRLPAGSYRLSAVLRVPPGGTLLGDGPRWENTATRLVIPAPGHSAVSLAQSAAVKGLAITYPNNQATEKPVPYPPAVLLEGINPSVEDIVFDGAWTAVSTPPGGLNAGQGMFRGLTGWVHHCGIHISGARDVNRFEDIHWFVGGTGPHDKAYFRHNRVGFEFGDVDGVIMDRCFMIFGKTFFRQLALKDTPSSAPEAAHSLGHHISQCWVEHVREGFVFEGACGFVLDSTNILVEPGGVGVRVAAGALYYNAVISGVQVRNYAGPARGIEVGVAEPASRNRIAISDCQAVDGAPALRLMGGTLRATIHGNHFLGAPGSPAVVIEPGTDLVSITGNILGGSPAILDRATSATQKLIRDNIVEE